MIDMSNGTPEVLIHTFHQVQGPTLIGLHGAGSMLFFRNLAQRLSKSNSFHVLQGKNMDRLDGKHNFHTIHGLSSSIADRIQLIDRQGPLFLCGCYGVIILETAQRLLDRGVKVDALLIFDSTGPPKSETPSNTSKVLSELVRPIRQWFSIPSSSSMYDWLKHLIQKPKAHKARKNSFNKINRSLLEHYQPAHYNGRIVLIRSEQFSKKESKRKHLTRWSAITNDFEHYTISGTHWTMFRPPHISELCRLIENIID
ncbi:MAG: thioesterase domain-containing protein [Parasphingorhabdus sp.]|jgi:thioesterase domain-containing protein